MVETIGNPVETPKPASGATIVSAALHLLVVGLLLHHTAAWVAPIRLPGSEHGANLLLTYSPGRAPVRATAPNPKTQPKQAIAPRPLPTPAPTPKPSTTSPNFQSPASAQPDSAAGADSLGSGNINIALASYFPPPKPDLSSLPRGTKGDVILDIVIDSSGKIADIKMTSGLGPAIDDNVIATVHQWTFHPATKDGQPVASEQELHFHYEKT
jgi:periplasmic protein TonB